MAEDIRDRVLRPVVIVDAYSRGTVLARAFSEFAPCVHVRSRARMPEIFVQTFERSLFVEELSAADSDRDALVAALRTCSPVAVVAGSEFGVELADLLSTTLGLPGNGVALSSARRDKFEMATVVARSGVSVPPRFRTSDLRSAIEWFRSRGGPIVVKPVDSAGSDNVFVCRTASEIDDAWWHIVGTTNIMMCENKDVLLQGYLEGDEYAVNSVSFDGAHWITDIWLYTKRLVAGARRRIYDRDDLIDPNCEVVSFIVPYVREVLDALGIRYGPAHTELFMTASGPQFVEMGARVAGTINPASLRPAMGGVDQVEMTVRCYLHPARMAEVPLLYRREKSACYVKFIAQDAGRLDHAMVRSFLSTLPSFTDVRFRVCDGCPVEPTVDLSTSPGALYLVSDSQAQIEQDYSTFRDWEARCYQPAGATESRAE